MMLALATVKRPSDLNLLRINPGAMQILEDSDTFQTVFRANNVRPNHLYGPAITLSWAEGKCLCLVRLTQEYIAKTKDREDWSDKLFVTRKMGPAVAVSSGTASSWLKQTLTLANIRASGGSTRKAAGTTVARQGASIRTIMEAGDWVHTSTMYGHYIRCMPKKVLVRILEQTSASIQGVNVAKIATDRPTLRRALYRQTWTSTKASTDKPTGHLLSWIERWQSIPKYVLLHFVWEVWPHSVMMNI